MYPWRENIARRGLMGSGTVWPTPIARPQGLYSRFWGANGATLPSCSLPGLRTGNQCRTAKTLGLAFTTSLLARTDEVIE